MAGHIDINLIPIEERSKTLSRAIESINKRLDYYKRHIPGMIQWKQEYVYGKRLVRMSPAYTDKEGYIPLDVGDYKVGKKLVHGGEATFEVHFNPKTNDRVIYLVA